MVWRSMQSMQWHRGIRGFMTLSNKIGEGNVITEKRESWRHYLAKVLLHKLIIEKGSKSKIEYNVGSRIIDVVQFLDDGQIYGYEIQSKGIKKKSQEMMQCVQEYAPLEDIKVIDLSKLDKDIDIMILELKEMII